MKRITPEEILDAWARFSNYDPERHRFNLLSQDYELHQIGKTIAKAAEYAPNSAELAILYLKQAYRRILGRLSISLLDLFESPEELNSYREMWEMLESPDVAAIEDGAVATTEAILEQAIGLQLPGDGDLVPKKERLRTAAASVIEELPKCKAEFYRAGGPIGHITKYSASIHSFSRLSECLMKADSWPDGMYVCIIGAQGPGTPYFVVLVKSNGTLLGIHDRDGETYPGQKGMSRRGWTRDPERESALFPYKAIENQQDGEIPFRTLEEEKLTALVLAMAMLASKYEGAEAAPETTVLIDRFLPSHIALTAGEGTETALALQETGLMAVTENYKPPFTAEEVLSGSFGTYIAEHHRGCGGEFPQQRAEGAQVLVDLFGKGFTLPENIVDTLPGTAEEMAKWPDFVGTKLDYDIEAYRRACLLLANHMRTAMYREFFAFGGLPAVKTWWLNACRDAQDRHLALVREALALCKDPKDPLKSITGQFTQEEMELIFQDGSVRLLRSNPGTVPEGIGDASTIWFTTTSQKPLQYHCPITGAKASVFVVIRPSNWKGMEAILGRSVPAIIKGWDVERVGYGNELLRATDAVTGVCHPWDSTEQQSLAILRQQERFYAQENGEWKPRNYRFQSVMALSKSGVNQLQKLH